VGVVVNVAAAAILARSARHSLNVRGAFLHLLTDLAAFAGTAVAGTLVLLTGWDRFDPLASLVVAVLIFWSAWRVLHATTLIFLALSPGGIHPRRGGRGRPASPPPPARLIWRLVAESLSGKTAIVTGASSGIGAAIARDLREAGVRVAGGARRTDRLETDVKLELDVTDAESCARFVDAAVAELGGLDILVNNAGLALGREPFDASTEEDEETVLETNVNGLIRMARLCLP